jgi:DNA-binding SARP family transcriptional activator
MVNSVAFEDGASAEPRTGRLDTGPTGKARDAGGLRLQLLQGFSLSRGGGRIAVPMAAQRLIAYLALENRSCHRLAVSGTLWLDTSEERAGASLRTVLWRLSQLAGNVVVVDGPNLTLTPEMRVDYAGLTKRANLLLSQPEESCERDLELLGVSGDLLPDWYDDWVLFERERLRQLRLCALEALCRELTRAGEYGQAVKAGMLAVRVEPLRESSHRALIAAHAAHGNAAEALRHYELFRQRIADELGLAPSRRMEMLIARVHRT